MLGARGGTTLPKETWQGTGANSCHLGGRRGRDGPRDRAVDDPRRRRQGPDCVGAGCGTNGGRSFLHLAEEKSNKGITPQPLAPTRGPTRGRGNLGIAPPTGSGFPHSTPRTHRRTYLRRALVLKLRKHCLHVLLPQPRPPRVRRHVIGVITCWLLPLARTAAAAAASAPML